MKLRTASELSNALLHRRLSGGGVFLRLGFSALCLLLVLSGCSRQPEVQPLPEALLTDLVRMEDRLHVVNDPEPFTGMMVEHYPDGAVKARSQLVDGLLDGISEGWYPNGALQVREPFVAGLSHGTRHRWYQNGLRQSSAEIALGKLNGLFERWHENGEPAERLEMKDGKPEGVSLAYFSTGYLKAYAVMEEGRILQQIFFADGEVREPPIQRSNNQKAETL